MAYLTEHPTCFTEAVAKHLTKRTIKLVVHHVMKNNIIKFEAQN